MTEAGYILEHRGTGARYRPVGCLHVFKSVESAALFRSVGFDAAGDWRARRVRVEPDGEVGEAEMAEALERVKNDGKKKVAEA